MRAHGKRFKNLVAAFDQERLYDAAEATQIVKRNATAKFNETVEIHIKLGVDPKKSDQNVRGTVNLPHGTGRVVRRHRVRARRRREGRPGSRRRRGR